MPLLSYKNHLFTVYFWKWRSIRCCGWRFVRLSSAANPSPLHKDHKSPRREPGSRGPRKMTKAKGFPVIRESADLQIAKSGERCEISWHIRIGMPPSGEEADPPRGGIPLLHGRSARHLLASGQIGSLRGPSIPLATTLTASRRCNVATSSRRRSIRPPPPPSHAGSVVGS